MIDVENELKENSQEEATKPVCAPSAGIQFRAGYPVPPRRPQLSPMNKVVVASSDSEKELEEIPYEEATKPVCAPSAGIQFRAGYPVPPRRPQLSPMNKVVVASSDSEKELEEIPYEEATKSVSPSSLGIKPCAGYSAPPRSPQLASINKGGVLKSISTFGNTETEREYKATLSKIITSFAGVAAKKEYRAAFLEILMVNVITWIIIYYIIGKIIENASENSVAASFVNMVFLIIGVTGVILVWDSIKIRIRRFHSFGHSFVINYLLPTIILLILNGVLFCCQYLLNLSEKSSGLIEEALGFCIMLTCFFLIIWEIVLFFCEAPCDNGNKTQSVSFRMIFVLSFFLATLCLNVYSW